MTNHFANQSQTWQQHFEVFFFKIEKELWKVMQSQDELKRTNFLFETPIPQVQIITDTIYQSIMETLTYFRSMSLKTS